MCLFFVWSMQNYYFCCFLSGLCKIIISVVSPFFNTYSHSNICLFGPNNVSAGLKLLWISVCCCKVDDVYCTLNDTHVSYMDLLALNFMRRVLCYIPHPMLEDYTFSSLCDCVFNIHATHHLLRWQHPSTSHCLNSEF
jgi:hypothetical protein